MTQQWQSEFPQFPADDMPTIPAEWHDVSWCNDACPCFEIITGADGDSNYQSMKVWVEESDPAKREVCNSKRFTVCYERDSDCYTALETDDWNQVVSYAEARRIIGKAFASIVGHNPFLDSPAENIFAVYERLKYHAATRIFNAAELATLEKANLI